MLILEGQILDEGDTTRNVYLRPLEMSWCLDQAVIHVCYSTTVSCVRRPEVSAVDSEVIGNTDTKPE